MRQNYLSRLFSWFLFFIATACLLDIVVARLHPYSYYPDRQAIGADGWKGRESYFAPAFLGLIPWQIPGPMDSGWAGKSPKSVGVQVPFHRTSRVTLSFMDSHDKYPPIIRASIHGKSIGDFMVTPGSGGRAAEWEKSGVRSEINIKVSDELTPGVLWLTPVQGSWAALEAVRVWSVSPKWEYWLSALSAVILAVIVRKEINIIQRFSRIVELRQRLQWRTMLLLGVGALLATGVFVKSATLYGNIIAQSNDVVTALDREVARAITCVKPGEKIRFYLDESTQTYSGQNYFITQYSFVPLILNMESLDKLDTGAQNKDSSRYLRLSTGVIETHCEKKAK